MTTETIIQLAQLSTVLIGSLGIAVAVRSHRRQMNAQMFIEFSARFQSMLRTLPAETWMGHSNGGQRMPPPSEDLTRSSLQCFHLVASLYHLRQRGYITRDLWRPSQRGIKRMLESPLLQREWFAVEPAFSHFPEYCRYVRKLISDGNYMRDRSLEALS